MKNLLLFEAFTSITIKSLLKYLDQREAKKVIDQLKDILKKHNYPIDKIKDEHISYDKLNNAIKLVPEGDGEYIKYFYDRDGKFVTKTITKSKSTSNKVSTRKDEFKIIKRLKDVNYEIPDGYIPILLCEDNYDRSDYRSLNTGDQVIALLGDEWYNKRTKIRLDKLVQGTIFKKTYEGSDETIWVIHDNDRLDGGEPDDEDNWKRYGEHSWLVFDGRWAEEDHLLVAVKKKEISTHEYQYDTPSRIDTKHEEADWALTIKLSDILSEDYKDVKDLNKERNVSREDALALKTDREIQIANQDKMNKYILSKMGIGKYVNGELVSDEKVILKNLQKIISTIIRSGSPSKQYAYEYLYVNDIDIDSITGLISNIVTNSALPIKDEPKSKSKHSVSRRDLEKYLTHIISKRSGGWGYDYYINEIGDMLYKTSSPKKKTIDTSDKSRLADKIGIIRKDSFSDIKDFENTYKSLNTISKRTNVYKFFNAIRSMSNQIGDYVRNHEIDNVEDLILLEIKLNSISTVLNKFNFSRSIGYALNGEVPIDDIRVTNKDIERLKIHKKYIDSILK